MADQLITDTAQITVGWLERVLRRSGALRAGAIDGFDLQAEPAAWSRSVRLRVRYTQDATGTLPTALFLKLYGGDEFRPVSYGALRAIDPPRRNISMHSTPSAPLMP